MWVLWIMPGYCPSTVGNARLGACPFNGCQPKWSCRLWRCLTNKHLFYLREIQAGPSSCWIPQDKIVNFRNTNFLGCFGHLTFPFKIKQMPNRRQGLIPRYTQGSIGLSTHCKLGQCQCWDCGGIILYSLCDASGPLSGASHKA